jgi:electron transfer flavoprotein alpha subunit
METILFLSHTEQDGTLPKAGVEALGAAKELADGLGGQLVVAVFGETTAPAAAQLAGSGAKRALAVTGAEFAQARYPTDAAAAEALAKASGATIVLAPSTSRLARVLPGVSHRLGGRVDTHATAIAAKDGAATLTRWFYRQRMEATLKRTQRPWVMLLDAGTHAPFLPRGAAPALEAVAVAIGDAEKRTKVTGFRAPKSDAQTIRPEAKLLFVAGAGWTKKQAADGKPHVEEAEKLILGFIGAAKASLGSSKSLTDQATEGHGAMSFMSHLNQIGQTGATPRHQKGLATCCHGEEPHVVGWRFVNERRAVNMDPNCGWARGKADVVYVADAFAVMAKVNALLGAK